MIILYIILYINRINIIHLDCRNFNRKFKKIYICLSICLISMHYSSDLMEQGLAFHTKKIDETLYNKDKSK